MKEETEQRTSVTPQAKPQVSRFLPISLYNVPLKSSRSTAMLSVRLRTCSSVVDTLGNDMNMMLILHELMRDFAGN